jgi:rod shape-determining protein MreD
MSGLMPRGTRQLLLPANPSFIWLSIMVGFGANIVQNFLLGGWVSWAPDYLMLILVFWSLHQPNRVGMGTAFFFGLAMDVHQITLLGQHALCYTLICFVVALLQRRVMWFKSGAQALQLLPLFALMHLLELSLRLMFGSAVPSWSLILSPILEALLWPVASALLLLPQRRTPDPDANRPL